MASLLRAGVHAYRRLKVASLGRQPSWRGVGEGLEMWIDPADWMDRAFYLGNYDPWLLHVVNRVVRRGDTCLDLGAHKGYVTMKLARRVGDVGRVLSFEPDPRARAMLENHCRHNRLKQVFVYPHALGRERGVLSFALSTQLGWSSLFPNAEASATTTESVTVTVRGIDELIERGELTLNPSHLRFVKIDVEGAEPLVLDGMRKLLASSEPVLWLEVNPNSLRAAGCGVGDIGTALLALDFRLYYPRRIRRWGVPQVIMEPQRRIDPAENSVFDLFAMKGDPEWFARG
jgi:FkbM family methyltransferase